MVLCGHSYGGMVITGVADRIQDKIRALVYLDAFIPEHGDSLIGLLHKSLAPEVAAQFIGAFRGLRVPARFSILVGLTLSVLAGYAVSELIARWPSRARLIVSLVLAIVVLDLYPRLELRQ